MLLNFDKLHDLNAETNVSRRLAGIQQLLQTPDCRLDAQDCEVLAFLLPVDESVVAKHRQVYTAFIERARRVKALPFRAALRMEMMADMLVNVSSMAPAAPQGEPA